MRALLAARPLGLPNSPSLQAPDCTRSVRSGEGEDLRAEHRETRREDPTRLGPSWDPLGPYREGPGRKGHVAQARPRERHTDVGNGSDQMRLEPPLLSSWGPRWGQFLGVWGRFPSKGREAESPDSYLHPLLPPLPPPSRGMESGRLRAGGDTKTYKSWEKNKQMDRRWQALGFVIPVLTSDCKTPNIYLFQWPQNRARKPEEAGGPTTD